MNHPVPPVRWAGREVLAHGSYPALLAGLNGVASGGRASRHGQSGHPNPKYRPVRSSERATVKLTNVWSFTNESHNPPP